MSGLFTLIFLVLFVYLIYLLIRSLRLRQRRVDRRTIWIIAAAAVSFFGVGTKSAGSFIFLLLIAGALYMAWKASIPQPVTMAIQPTPAMENGEGINLMERIEAPAQSGPVEWPEAAESPVILATVPVPAPTAINAVKPVIATPPQLLITQVRDIPQFQVTDAYPPMMFQMLNPQQPTLLYDGEHDSLLIVWGKQRSGELAYEPVTRRSITEAEILEDGMTVTKTSGKASTSMLSQGGRAVVGGLVAGPVGFIIGGATGSKHKKETSVSQNVVSRVVLRLVTRNGNVPIVEYSLLKRPAAPNSNEYMKARRTADIWHIRINQQLLKDDERQAETQ